MAICCLLGSERDRALTIHRDCGLSLNRMKQTYGGGMTSEPHGLEFERNTTPARELGNPGNQSDRSVWRLSHSEWRAASFQKWGDPNAYLEYICGLIEVWWISDT